MNCQTAVVIGTVVSLVLGLWGAPLAYAAPEVPITTAISAYCDMWTPTVQWLVSPVAGNITTGFNGRWERDAGEQVRVGETVYGVTLWPMGIVASAEIYEDGVLVGTGPTYLDCTVFDFEDKGNIRLVDAVAIGGGVRITFLINPLPEAIPASPLTVSGIANGQPFFDWPVPVDRRVGLWTFFAETFPGPVASLIISTASASMESRHFGFQNPGPVSIRTPYSVYLPLTPR